MFTAVSCLLTGCIGMIGSILKGKYSGDMAYNYNYGDAKIVNEYIENVVKALDTNDRELLVSLFPEYARSKIDNFDEKINTIFKEYGYYAGSMIRYKLNWDNDYESISDRGKLQRKVYASTTIEFTDKRNRYNLYPSTIQIYMLIRPVDNFNDNNVGISKFAIDDGNLYAISEELDADKDGYDIYAFGQ